MLLIRAAVLNDSSELLRWRNDSATVAASATTDLISEENHDQWLHAVLTSDSHFLYIGERRSHDAATETIGMSRFDLTSDRQSAVVSLNLNPAHRGKGLAGPFLLASVGKFRSEFHPVALTASIRRDNLPSRRVFLTAGFIQIGGSGDFDEFQLEPDGKA